MENSGSKGIIIFKGEWGRVARAGGGVTMMRCKTHPADVDEEAEEDEDEELDATGEEAPALDAHAQTQETRTRTGNVVMYEGMEMGTY